MRANRRHFAILFEEGILQVNSVIGKTIVIGSSGYIGQALWKTYREQWRDLERLDRHSEPRIDLQCPRFDQLPFSFPEYQWAVIAGAMTKIAVCEKEKELSHQINVVGTLQLIDQILQKGMTPIIFSTDYVFDGKLGGYDEESPLNPLNEYGGQKAIVDQEVKRICQGNYLILRLGKVAGKDLNDKTLLSEMAQLLAQGKTVRAAYDQRLTPIFLDDVVQGILALQKIRAKGLYHLCGREIWSRLELAKAVAKKLNIEKPLIEPISLDDLGESFVRPKRTDMSSEKFIKATCYPLQSIRSYIEEEYGLPSRI